MLKLPIAPFLCLGVVIASTLLWLLHSAVGTGGLPAVERSQTALIKAVGAWRLREGRFVWSSRTADCRVGTLADKEQGELGALNWYRNALADIGELAREPLSALAAGKEITQEMHEEIKLVEARIRDSIRFPQFCNAAFQDAVDSARRRGATVHIVGECDSQWQVTPECAETLTRWVSKVGDGSITIRVMPPGRDATISVVITEGAFSERVYLSV